MHYSRSLFITVLAILSACSPFCLSEETPTEEQRRTEFLAEYNGLRADKRLAAISTLRDSKEQRSIEALYFVSWRDSDPEVRSHAFPPWSTVTTTYGYIAHWRLTASSAKRSSRQGGESGGDGLAAVQVAALNELVGFLRTLRWAYWDWNWRARSAGYVAAGIQRQFPANWVEQEKAAVDTTGTQPRAAPVAQRR